MRHWLPILSLIALLLYAGWVLDRHREQPDRPAISALNTVMAKAGGSLESARFLLVAPITDPATPARLRERLGWKGSPPGGEQREAWLQTQEGAHYLVLNWQMVGEAAQRWAENHPLLTRALEEAGVATPFHVELQGKIPGKRELLTLAHRALDELGASARQPWTGERSASVAGWSARLPSGPHEVNVQVAARQTEEAVRLWVAWPALTGDY
ncbi:MAG: hypothetical protein ACOY93_11115 [Bacillota bacterium]